MGDQNLWDETYYGDDADNNYVKLMLEFDGDSVKLKAFIKKLPVGKQSAAIWAKRKSGGKWVIDFGAGDEEYSEDDLPNPIKKLIASGGAGKDQVGMPPKSSLIKNYTIRPYAEYCSIWKSRRQSGKDFEKALTKPLFHELAKTYLEMMGTPLYL